MKRPAAVCGFTSAVGLLLTILLFGENLKAQLLLFIICIFLFLFSNLIKSFRNNKAIPVIFLSLSISFILLFFYSYSHSKTVSRYENKTADISAHFISSAKFSDGRYLYTVKTDTVNGKKEKLKIELSLKYPLNANIADEIYISCTPVKPHGNKMYSLNKLSNGTDLFVNKINSLSISENAAFSSSKDITVFILKFRSILENNILMNLRGQNGALLVGFCFGDKGNLSRQIITDFRTCGISHLLAVSGLHLTVWSGALYLVLNKLKINKKVISVICTVFIIFFSALTGFGVPVVRAGFMFGLFYIGFLFNKEPDALNSMGAALCILLLINPFSAVSVSLWLSVLSTLGLISFSKLILDVLLKPFQGVEKKFILKPLYFVLSAISVSLSATVFCIPVYTFVFPAISLIQIISNIIFVFIGSAAMVSGGISSVLFAFKAKRLGKIFVLFAGFLSESLIKGVSRLSRFRYSVYPISGVFVKVSLLVLFAAVLLAVFGGLKKSNMYKKALSVATVFIIIINVVLYIDEYRSARLSFLNSKCGTVTMISYKGQNILLSYSSDYYDGTKLCDLLYRRGAGFVDLTVVQGSFVNAKPIQRVNESYRIKTSAFNDKISEGYIRAKNDVLITEPKSFLLSSKNEKMEISSDGNAITLYANGRKIIFDLTEEQKLSNISSDLYISRQSIVNKGDIDVIITSNGKIKVNKGSVWQ